MFQPERLWPIAKQRIGEMMRDAEQRRLSHLSPQPTWLSRQIRRLLRRLGRWLIRVNQLPQQKDCCQRERLTP